MLQDKDLVSIQQARKAVEKAAEAGLKLKKFSQEQVDAIVAAMAEAARRNARALAELAVSETTYGKVEDKVTKNLFSAVQIYGYLKDLKTCGVISENKEKHVVDIAVPVGVVAAVIPTTNPTSTAIFKILSSVKGRNTVVVAPHPRAVKCTIETARVMEEAGRQAGAPEGFLNWIEDVTLDGTSALMRHKKTGVILATGGPGMVRAAYSSGKPAFGVGSGNVPAFIERTADIPKAVRDIVAGKTFDWGLLCSSEQSIVCDRPIEDQVIEELGKCGAHIVDEDEKAKLCRLIQTSDGRLNTDIVGQSPQKIATMAGFSIPESASCLVGRADGVGRDHPLSREKLSPILGFYVEDGWEAGCHRCIELLEYGGLGHTLSIHSKDKSIILEFGLQKPAHRICVNTPSTHGSVGLTTGVPPSMTLGCGSPGGNITSDNITALHLINIKRLAYGIREVDQIHFEGGAETSPVGGPVRHESSGLRQINAEQVRDVVRGVVEQYLNEKKKATDRPEPAPPPVQQPPPNVTAPIDPPVEFVCEDDVRRAIAANKRIVVCKKTIITPAARDLGTEKGTFIEQ